MLRCIDFEPSSSQVYYVKAMSRQVLLSNTQVKGIRVLILKVGSGFFVEISCFVFKKHTLQKYFHPDFSLAISKSIKNLELKIYSASNARYFSSTEFVSNPTGETCLNEI